jgi:hypothetical protein
MLFRYSIYIIKHSRAVLVRYPNPSPSPSLRSFDAAAIVIVIEGIAFAIVARSLEKLCVSLGRRIVVVGACNSEPVLSPPTSLRLAVQAAQIFVVTTATITIFFIGVVVAVVGVVVVVDGACSTEPHCRNVCGGHRRGHHHGWRHGLS